MVARGIVVAEGDVVLAGVVVATPYNNIMISWKMGLGRGKGEGEIQSRLLPGEGLYCFAFPKSCVVQAVLHFHSFLEHIEGSFELHAVCYAS